MSIQCQACGATVRGERFAAMRSASWSDDCACSDLATCLYHRTNAGGPSRPDQDVLVERARREVARDYLARQMTILAGNIRTAAGLCESWEVGYVAGYHAGDRPWPPSDDWRPGCGRAMDGWERK